MPSTPRLFLIDGNNQMYRAYHALHGLTGPDGRSTNAVYGFITMLRKLLSAQHPDLVAAAFDLKGPTFRHELAADYKATRRPMPEDLVEQVIGEIEDEHDLEEGALWMQEPSGSWLVEARAPLEEFEEASGLSLVTEDVEEEEIDTLGGLVFLEAGRVPARGEVIEHPSGAEFEVVDAEPRRIKRLRVRLPGEGKA